MSNWEDTFIRWSKGPSRTEEEKCSRAVDAIRKAIDDDTILSKRSIEVFAQGSYRNRTNIRIESDVDVCICCHDTLLNEYPTGTNRETFGLVASSYTFSRFKGEVEQALVNHFGRSSVTRGNKAFDIHESSYRVDADAVPAFEHRQYFLAESGLYRFHQGIQLRPDNGGKIINWPQQVYDNGVWKRDNTDRRYKKIIRILKNLRNKMHDDKIPQAADVASFLVECLVWNTPNNLIGHDTLTEDIRRVLAFQILNTHADQNCSQWNEVNELKPLFVATQPWTRRQAYRFVCGCWLYLGFN